VVSTQSTWGENKMLRQAVVSTATLLLLGQHALASRQHGPFSGQRNMFTRDMRDFSVADQGRFWGGSLGWGIPIAKPRPVKPSWSGMVLGLGKRSPGSGSLYQGAPPSLEDTGMLLGMGKRALPMMEVPFRPPKRNPRWNRHHRIQRGAPSDAMQARMEDEMEMEENEEEEEVVKLIKKRSGFTIPTPNVADAGMLMGMGKRSFRYLQWCNIQHDMIFNSNALMIFNSNTLMHNALMMNNTYFFVWHRASGHLGPNNLFKTVVFNSRWRKQLLWI